MKRKTYRVKYAQNGQEWNTRVVTLKHDGWNWVALNDDGTKFFPKKLDFFEISRREVRV